jgi:transmembrane sensor
MSVEPPAAGVTEQASAWCLRLSEGEMSASEQQAFEAWMASDPANPAAFDDAVRIWRSLDQASLTPGLVNLRLQALESFRRASRSRWTPPTGRWPTWASMAAAVALVVVLAGGAWLVNLPTVYSTGVGERRVVALSDGSKLSLDGVTRVEARFKRDRRDLRLVQGRAKFSVARDPGRPFSVAAADKLVIATGTEFSVETLADTVRVVLYEGRVTVRTGASLLKPGRAVTTGAAAEHADRGLTPGRELITRISAESAKLEAADLGRSSAWEAGQIVFVDEPLSTAVERVNRYAERPLAVGDAGAAQIRVNGVYRAGDTRAFVEGVTGVLPIAEREEGGRTVLVSASR